MMKKNVVLIMLLLMAFFCTAQEKTKEFQLEFEKVPLSAKFIDDTRSIWGASMIKGEDGLYHMYYSRWKKELGWAWVTHSEIAHAVSKSPFGPFEHNDVALPIRGAKFWDGLCTHNPTVHKFDGRYYLYYMGNTGDGKIYGEPGKAKLNPVHRNNQRIGVAVADNPNGPWNRFDKPLIDVSPDSAALDALMTSNPSITQRPDGGYLMVYKAVGKMNPGIWGGPVVHCVATSDSPTGPFKKYSKPVFQAKGHDFPAEDPFIWYQDGKYRAIVKDMHGAFTDAGQALVMFDSEDGFDWNLAEKPLVSTLKIDWGKGGTQLVKHLERPQLYIENGKPAALLCAADTLDEKGVIQSWNVQIPIKQAAKIIDLSQWKLVWNDEFDYPDKKLDKNWEAQNGPSGHILCSRWRENAVVHDGILELIAKKEKRGGQDWTAASLWTKAKFKYGYFECRYKYAGAETTNNSFWLMTRGEDPKVGKRFEIDINEGNYPKIINTNIHNHSDHILKNGKQVSIRNPKRFNMNNAYDNDFSEEFHTYGLEWNKEELIFYFDGKEIRRVKNEFCHSETPIWLSLALVKWYGTLTDAVDGTSMKVDYVRYYQQKNDD